MIQRNEYTNSLTHIISNNKQLDMVKKVMDNIDLGLLT